MASREGMSVLGGGCHCGRVRYRFSSAKPEALVARRCECSFCRRHGAGYLSDCDGELLIEPVADAVLPYRFASKAVDFLLCRHCGVLTVALSRIDGGTYAVINAATLDVPMPVQAASVDFSEETPEEAAARRKRNWIARVAWQGSGGGDAAEPGGAA